jgi:hypothetical protein
MGDHELKPLTKKDVGENEPKDADDNKDLHVGEHVDFC